MASSAAAVALAASATALATGGTPVPVSEVALALIGQGDPQTELVVGTLRLPRVVCGLLVGAALALAGALTQTVTRNPLASPDVLGVTSGAGVGAVAVVVLAGGAGGASGTWAAVGVPAAAVLGACVAAAAVAALSRSTERMVLVGVGLTAAAQGAVSWLLALGEVQDAGRAAAWLAGSLNGRTWAQVLPVAVALAVAAGPLLAVARALALIGLDEGVAATLGVAVGRTQVTALAVAVLLAAVATAAAGPIAFVALAAPHAAARTTGQDRPPAAISALLGAALVAASDLLARNVFGWFGGRTVELPVGIVTGALGAGYLILILSRGRPTR